MSFKSLENTWFILINYDMYISSTMFLYNSTSKNKIDNIYTLSYVNKHKSLEISKAS